MTDKYLVIFTDKETGKYDHYDLYPKEICSEEELIEKIKNFNDGSSNLKAEWHNDDVFTDFVQDVSSVSQRKNLISNLKSIVNSINTNISELESWSFDIQELLEEINNDR